MKTLQESIIGRKTEKVKPGSFGSLYKALENFVWANRKSFIISMDSEDNLLPELSEEYGLSELILKRDDSQKKMFKTNNTVIELVSIQVKPALRNRGLASKVLEEISSWADDNNIILTGDPDDMFGVPLDKLYELYGRFGFERSEEYDTVPNVWGHVHKIVRFPR